MRQTPNLGLLPMVGYTSFETVGREPPRLTSGDHVAWSRYPDGNVLTPGALLQFVGAPAPHARNVRRKARVRT